MNVRILQSPPKWVWLVVVAVVVGAGWLTTGWWLPATANWGQQVVGLFRTGSESSLGHDHGLGADPHAGHGHGHEPHAGHDEATSLELSAQALRNIGLDPDAIRPVELTTFRKSITVPAMVVERPGRTRVQVAAPMTGVVMRVHAVQGESVEPGALLFQIRLTHEDLVQAQTGFLQTLGELDVEQREIVRLEGVTESGAVARKVLLDRIYAKDKLTALLRAQREALRLHGLSDQQVDQIETARRLLRELQVFAPSADDQPDDELKLTGQPFQPVSSKRHLTTTQQTDRALHGPLILQQLSVHKGQSVRAGETLCILADYGELFIEGQAFERDINQLRRASERGWTVDAIFEHPETGSHVVAGLETAYLANQVDVDSRTLHFYVRLPNEITKDRRPAGGRYVEWRYLPGQRLQVRVPVEEWRDQIVLPVGAVARAGAEYFVFQQNGSHFDRLPVHVKYRDQHAVVIDSDGSLYPGDVVATRGAHQMLMALKNKAGGGVDPHAGHTH